MTVAEQVVGKYLVEVWKATGMDMDRVKFVWSSDEITNNATAYWTQVGERGWLG